MGFHDGLLARISHQRSSRGRRGAVVTGRTVTRNIVKRTPCGDDAAAKRVLELLAEAASASTVLVPTAVSVLAMAASVDR